MKQIYRLYGISDHVRYPSLLIALTLTFFLWFPEISHAQVNSYAKVTAITTSSGKSVLTISNLNQTYHTFAVGEQVIVMQMQDNVIGTNTGNTASFGNLASISNAGLYEIATISLISGTTMTLTTVLGTAFAIGNNSSVQVVSFTKLGTTNYTTTDTIPAVTWNGGLGTGGVVAFQVNGTLTLNYPVTADGQGFSGGAVSGNYQANPASCEPGQYINSSTNYAAKGEGIYKINTTANAAYTRARAKVLSGGGGASVGNAGGAGGGNYSTGGDGGPGYTCTGANVSGGLGGIALNTYLSYNGRIHLFMGGGGGGGQGNDGVQTAGGNGGGIIIIKAKIISTGCASATAPIKISANGATSSSTTGVGYDGAGGAGAGGTIILEVPNFTVPASCKLEIQANGGNGGNVNSDLTHGGGGGGGQGAVLFSFTQPSTNVTTVTTPGLGGLNSNLSTATRAGGGSGTSTSGIITGIGVVLPLRLLDFTAENNNKKALLRWTAGGEANTLFTVQHATDGIHFTTIGTVKGADNSNTANYTFTDNNAVAGKNYYQLQMTSDLTTQATYSSIVSLNMTEVQSIAVAWPNPAHDHFNIKVDYANSNKNHVVTITDLTGKVMYTNTYKPANGIITVTPGSPLKPGLYLFKLISEGYEQSGKLFIQ